MSIHSLLDIVCTKTHFHTQYQDNFYASRAIVATDKLISEILGFIEWFEEDEVVVTYLISFLGDLMKSHQDWLEEDLFPRIQDSVLRSLVRFMMVSEAKHLVSLTLTLTLTLTLPLPLTLTVILTLSLTSTLTLTQVSLNVVHAMTRSSVTRASVVTLELFFDITLEMFQIHEEGAHFIMPSKFIQIMNFSLAQAANVLAHSVETVLKALKTLNALIHQLKPEMACTRM